MKGSFVKLVLASVLILNVGCEKSETNNLPTSDSQEQTGNENGDISMYEWKVPATLPDDIGKILADAPCWIAFGAEWAATYKNGKLVVPSEDNMYDGGTASLVCKFGEKECEWYAATALSLMEGKYHKSKIEWSKIMIVSYSDGVLVFSPSLAVGYPSEGRSVPVYTMKVGTQKELDDVIAKVK